MISHRWLAMALPITIALAACGGDSSSQSGNENAEAASSASAANDTPSGSGVCALLTQGEVDELFRTSIGFGQSEVLDDTTELCSWPANEDPAMLLQVSPAAPDVRSAVAVGDGYDVIDIDGMAGPTAAAVEQADGPAAVVVIAMTYGDKTLTLSPVGLGIASESERFERLKAILDAVANRL